MQLETRRNRSILFHLQSYGESRTISFYHRSRTIGEVKGNAVVNWIFFIIDGLGSIFGSVMAYWLVLRDAKYCNDCKRYMKKKSILKFWLRT